MSGEKKYFHMFANGDDARGFIICKADFIYEFNAIAVCAYESQATVLGFSLEETHPHALLYGTRKQCSEFNVMFTDMSMRHIIKSRGTSDGVSLHIMLKCVDDEEYLLDVGAYIIIQPTKDGKQVMYYDYRWGTGSMYFRRDHISIWRFDDHGCEHAPRRFCDLTYRERRSLCGTHLIPDGWLICNGIILPENYVDVLQYEKIYRTHNRFRTFAGAGRKQTSRVSDRMSEVRGLMVDDLEARRLCSEESISLFGTRDIRRMDVRDRYLIAKSLRDKYSITHRQLALLTRIPESELEKYIR